MNSELTEPIKDVVYRDTVVSRFEELRKDLRRAGWSVQSWTDPPDAYHAPHDHPYSHRVLCRSGWIEFTVDDTSYRLGSGDALDLPRRVTHEATSHPQQSTEYWLLKPQ